MVNFCLDSSNIVQSDGIEINGIRFKQDPETLIPSMMKNLLTLKDLRKAELNNASMGTQEYKNAETKYNAIKGLVNSGFGGCGYSGFRLFDIRIAGTITFLVRNLLDYAMKAVELEGDKVIYYDTDSVFLKSKEQKLERLNQIVQQWAKEKYGKDKVTIEFDYEGDFKRLFIGSTCHYYGELLTKKGKIKTEIKGLEMKRAGSSKYESGFQKEFILKLLDKEPKEMLVKWLEKERERIKTLPLTDVAFPSKLRNDKTYKVDTIVTRAAANGKLLNKKFNPAFGELFYYAYVKPMGHNNGKAINVVAFSGDDVFITPSQIDWEEMTRRNIMSKAENIFDSMHWSKEDLRRDLNQSMLF